MLPLLKLTLVFAAIVLLIGRRWNLGLVLILAAVAVGLLFSYPLPEVVRAVLLTAVDLLTLRLALAVVLIMVLGELLRQTAGLTGMIESLQQLIPDGRVVIAALPALIGLLPMVGGAMFSAPLVDEVGARLGVSPARKTFVNYWFRHIWEPVFPLYPSLMLGAALLGLTMPQVARLAWPLLVAAVAGGTLFGLVGMPRHGDQVFQPDADAPPPLLLLARSVWPILLVIALSLTLPVDERFTLIAALLITLTLVVVVQRVPLGEMVTILRERVPWTSVIVIFGALIFRAVLERSGAMEAVSGGLASLRVPPVLAAFGLPFIAGLLTGMMAAAYSIGFPVILPLLAAADGSVAAAWKVWLLAAGLAGTMLSPVHLCLALTRVYFKAEWGAVYRFLIPAALLVVATAGAILWSGTL